ncbi:Cytochrome P450 [Sphingobium faniae]|nr:Cytochrome P450 [Sphingobium faniae]
MSEQKVMISFDHHSQDYKKNWAALADDRARNIPLAWTEAHGGYWVLSSHADLVAAANDSDRFSSAHGDPDKPWAKGILIPELPYNLSLSESDPPVHTGRRHVEAPYFTPKSMRNMLPIVEKHIDEAMAEFIGKGECDLATDFAMRVAAQNTISLVGIDPAHWKTFMLSAHQATLLPSTHPDYPLEEIKFVQSLLRELLVDRAENPRDDILSALATKAVGGERLDLDIQVGMVSAAIFGGFGTVMSTTLSAVLWLERNPQWHARLLVEDALIDRLVNEILRVYPPNHGTARTIGRDFEMHGQTLRRGERIMLSWAAGNRDPKVFENPSEVRLDRPNAADHLSFSTGHHRCLGAPLARLEIRHMLRALLHRMPDFRIDHERLDYYPSFANNAGVVNMPVTFTPGTLP